jgi:hypothetical protein
MHYNKICIINFLIYIRRNIRSLLNSDRDNVSFWTTMHLYIVYPKLKARGNKRFADVDWRDVQTHVVIIMWDEIIYYFINRKIVQGKIKYFVPVLYFHRIERDIRAECHLLFFYFTILWHDDWNNTILVFLTSIMWDEIIYHFINRKICSRENQIFWTGTLFS